MPVRIWSAVSRADRCRRSTYFIRFSLGVRSSTCRAAYASSNEGREIGSARPSPTSSRVWWSSTAC
ncbi:hypothetical protein UK12_22700 [Saccharothrix sp. ST-888]|nr:hypothetical protein UK12_22700 [Saccharothrix sp. ST-888]